ncbi:MAG: glycerophosphoryl diester phosphodiesterase [Propionibacterium sp.]|nr:glycerophosphoryl diester phosphodiesterase [Propionibacterium sp.]MDN6566288.1 glycerophosphoryl diester phosphodiesterase [Actinomyces sp.]MDN6794465.1 glycerophosphoryl diester phosphodiesterase [Propionibacterium sp.]
MSEFPRILAHRGASSLAPENTMAAFVKAMEVGAHWIEFDVDIMGDGTLLVMHDHTLDRTTSGRGGYYDKGFSDLRKLDAGAWFSDVYRFEPVPEAADVLEFLNATGMHGNLEIKPCLGGEELRERVIETLVHSVDVLTDQDNFLVSSFDHDLLARFGAERPDIDLAWLVDPDDPEHGEWRPGATALGCRAINPGDEGLTEATVAQMLEAGFEVNVWTVDSVARARELAGWGVTGIFTNRPQDFPESALIR